MHTVWRKLRWSVTQRGLLGTLKAAAKALTRTPSTPKQHPFDQRYGTETSGLIGGGSLATGHRHDAFITGYSGVPPSRFQAALERWEATLGSGRVDDYTFIDLGCGKGRALLLASRMPFREVIGIELNPQLAAIAQRNVEHWESLGEALSPIRVETGDATEPKLPNSPVLLFLYNAFAEPLVRRLADNIASSKGIHRIDLIYQNAYHTDVFARQPCFLELWRGELPLSAEDASADPVASSHDITVLLRVDRKGETRV